MNPRHSSHIALLLRLADYLQKDYKWDVPNPRFAVHEKDGSIILQWWCYKVDEVDEDALEFPCEEPCGVIEIGPYSPYITTDNIWKTNIKEWRPLHMGCHGDFARDGFDSCGINMDLKLLTWLPVMRQYDSAEEDVPTLPYTTCNICGCSDPGEDCYNDECKQIIQEVCKMAAALWWLREIVPIDELSVIGRTCVLTLNIWRFQGITVDNSGAFSAIM